MEKHVVRRNSGYATGRKVMIFTHHAGSPDDIPAVVYDPQHEVWWIENNGLPLSSSHDLVLVREAITAIEEQTWTIKAMIASEQG